MKEELDWNICQITQSIYLTTYTLFSFSSHCCSWLFKSGRLGIVTVSLPSSILESVKLQNKSYIWHCIYFEILEGVFEKEGSKASLLLYKILDIIKSMITKIAEYP